MRRALASAAAILTLAAAGCSAGSARSAGPGDRGNTVAPSTGSAPISPHSPSPAAPAAPRRAAVGNHHPFRDHVSSHGAATPLGLTVRSASDGRRILSAPVDPIEAQVGTGIFPPVWDRAVYWTGSHRPASPSRGATLVYAHACTHHVCPFTDLHDAHPGDSVVLTTARGRFVYRIAKVLSLPKVDLASFSFSGYDLALITCELPGEGSELDNRMVLGTLEGFVPARH